MVFQDLLDDLDAMDPGRVLSTAKEAGEGVCSIPRATFGAPSSSAGVAGRAVEAAARLAVRTVGGMVE